MELHLHIAKCLELTLKLCSAKQQLPGLGLQEEGLLHCLGFQKLFISMAAFQRAFFVACFRADVWEVIVGTPLCQPVQL